MCGPQIMADHLGEGAASPPLSITSRRSAVGSSRKRRSSVTLNVPEDLQLLDDEKAICLRQSNPNPDNNSSWTTDSANNQGGGQTNYDTTSITVSSAVFGETNREGEQIQQQSNSVILHRAKSCLALVGDEHLHESNQSLRLSETSTGEMAGGQHGPVLYASQRQMKRIKSEPSIVVLANACVDGEEQHGYDTSASDGCSSTSTSTSRSRRSSGSVGLYGASMKQLLVGLSTMERPDSAIVSVDGSNEGFHAMPLDHAPMKDDGTTEDDVSSTPAYGVPPHPQTCPVDMDPDTFVKRTVQAYLGYEPKVLPGLSLPSPGFFLPITDDALAAYDADVVSAVRENQITEIRSYHEQGRTLSCCNRFGESLIHMACRRGYADVVTYLLEEANVSVRIRDDCGRTPLHDACWHRDTQYEIVDTIIRRDPALLFVSDKRGHTPFAYARKEHWHKWRQFLFDRTDWIVAGFARKEIAELFGSVDDQ